MKQKMKKGLHPDLKSLLFLIGFLGFFCIFAIPMGLGNAINTLMNTAYELLIGTVLYIMAIAVIAGAISGLLTEFGVVALLNKILSPLMRPLFGMPGASALGIVSTYLSDNPAILALADDKKFRRYFKAYQIPALTNLGTAFGMGLIVTSFTLGMSGTLGSRVWVAALCGNLGAVIGAIVSTRIMLLFMKRQFGTEQPALAVEIDDETEDPSTRHKGVLHILDAVLEGGKKGVQMGLTIIPGVLIICSLVLMLTNGRPSLRYQSVMVQCVGPDGVHVLASTDSIPLPEHGNALTEYAENSTTGIWLIYGAEAAGPVNAATDGRVFSAEERIFVRPPFEAWTDTEYASYRLVLVRDNGSMVYLPLQESTGGYLCATVPTANYSGGAYEGIGLLPMLADKLSFLLQPMFGFSSGSAIAVPVTALGSAGAALGLIPGFAQRGLIDVNDLAVFTAICMCWSGYLSTHVSMMEVLGCRKHTGKAIMSHTVGGLAAGVAAHWLFILFTRVFHL